MTEVKGRSSTKKSTARKKSAAKTTKSKTTSKSTKASPSVSAEQREQMIRDAAYFRAESRGFVGGNPEQDWLDAEVEIDKLVSHNA